MPDRTGAPAPAAPSLRTQALAALIEPDPQAKRAAVAALAGAGLPTGADLALSEPPGLPGRPPRPHLVDHRRIRLRPAGTVEGRAGLLHAVAHIEFNAINLALDAIWRFKDLPEAWYRDWLRVASEEAQHFGLLVAHLAGLGFRYGDFDAHSGLWDMAERTRHDLVARLALVPRTLEARGLDASPPLRHKLAAAGDAAGAAIIDVLLADEIGHVAIGNRWYAWACARQGLDPVAIWPGLAQQYGAPRPRPPLNLEARRAAGFSETELDTLLTLSGEGPAVPLSGRAGRSG